MASTPITELTNTNNNASLLEGEHWTAMRPALDETSAMPKGKRCIGIDECEHECKCRCLKATSDGIHRNRQSDSGSTYTVSSITSTTLGIKLALSSIASESEFGRNIPSLVAEFSFETNDRFHVKIYDPNNARWEVPASASPIPTPPSCPPVNPQYEYEYANIGEPFFFTIIRRSNSEVVFSTLGTKMQFAEQYLELSTILPTNYNIYGLGEHIRSFRVPPHTLLTLWNLDIATPSHVNLLVVYRGTSFGVSILLSSQLSDGSHPFYLDLRPSGDAHGVFLRNCNGMDVKIDTNLLTYKIIGGILDFYFMLGPEPEAVVQQYHEIIGRPHMPPYWSLGWHQGRYGFQNIKDVEGVTKRYSENQIPLEAVWSDIDHMDDYKNFTLEYNNYSAPEVQNFVEHLHRRGMRYVVILDPAIKIEHGYEPYDDGLKQGIYIKDKNGKIYVGRVWPGLSVYPDFLNPATFPYWQKQIAKFRTKLVDFDGLWLDMNEPSNFTNRICIDGIDDGDHPDSIHNPYEHVQDSSGNCPITNPPNGLPQDGDMLRESTPDPDRTEFTPDNPPYAINNAGCKAALSTKAVVMTAVHHGGILEYNCKNLYGHVQGMVTQKALENITGKRTFILSRSTWPGSGAYVAHWTGDNHATFDDMYYSIPGMLSFQLFGIPHVGSDVFGFDGECCSEWMEPYVWSSVAAIARKVLAIRYSILPYYYTLFYKAHRPISPGNAPAATVVRPLFFEFPTDPKTYDIDQQFLIGSGLLISPVLKQGATSVSAYFPAGKWYDWYSHEVVSSAGGETKELPTPRSHIQFLLSGSQLGKLARDVQIRGVASVTFISQYMLPNPVAAAASLISKGEVTVRFGKLTNLHGVPPIFKSFMAELLEFFVFQRRVLEYLIRYHPTVKHVVLQLLQFLYQLLFRVRFCGHCNSLEGGGSHCIP
eukprot:Em0023g785a